MRILAMTATVVLAALSGTASDAVELNDLRLQGMNAWTENRPDNESTTTIGGLAFRSSDDDTTSLDRHYRISAQWMSSFHPLTAGDAGGGPIYGLDLGYDRGEEGSRDQGVESRSNGFVLDVLPGWGWAATDRLHVELNGLFGVGWIVNDLYVSFPGIVEGDDRDKAAYIEYGVRAAAYYTCGAGWQAGVDVRYTWARVENEWDIEDAGNTVHAETTSKLSGLSAGVGIGYRFH
jgi:hypothetical protein